MISSRSAHLRSVAVRGWVLPLVAALAGTAPLAAGEVVLATGKVLEVEAVRPDGDDLWLDLPGGGSLAVPREHVRIVRDVQGDDTPPPGSAPTPTAVPAPPEGEPTLDRIIREAAERHGVDPRLVQAVIQAESAGDTRAVSPRGAMGLMQLMPATARARGVSDPFDPAENIDAGTAELAAWIDGYAGEIALALAAYNAGGRAVDRHEGIPPYRETLGYVRRVLDLYLDEPLSTPPSR